MTNKILKKVELTRVDGGCTVAAERIVKETALSIHIDGRHYATAMILATLEKEYVIGHLYAQGVIRRAADIKSITIKSNTAEVTLAATDNKKPDVTAVTSDLKVLKEDVFDCVRAILKSPVFSETEAVHSAGLFLHGREPVCIAEDLGRHNALDKVIGYSLLHDVDFRQTLAASTGRQPSEM
ncbi:MAG: formate dehydrogenase, partial [Chloroflexi bacterium RBG_13_52_12]